MQTDRGPACRRAGKKFRRNSRAGISWSTAGKHAAGRTAGVHIDRDRTGRLKYEIRKAV